MVGIKMKIYPYRRQNDADPQTLNQKVVISLSFCHEIQNVCHLAPSPTLCHKQLATT
jgi:hypothetical protein